MHDPDGRNPIIKNAPTAVENQCGDETVQVVLEREACDADQRVEAAVHRPVPSPEARKPKGHNVYLSNFSLPRGSVSA